MNAAIVFCVFFLLPHLMNAQPQPGAFWPQEGRTASKSNSAWGEGIYGPSPTLPARIDWQFTAPFGSAAGTSGRGSSPVVGADGTVYIASDWSDPLGIGAGVLRAISSTGVALWSYNLPSGSGLTPALTAEGLVIVCTDTGIVLALYASSGILKWTQTISGGTAAVLDNVGRVFFGMNSGVVCYNASTGLQLWQTTTGVGGVEGTPALSFNQTLLYVPARAANAIIALRVSTGAIAFRTPTVVATLQSGIAVGPDERMFVGQFGGAGILYAFSGVNGSLLWSYPNIGSIRNQPCIGPRGEVVVGGDGGIFVALNGANGTLRWQGSLGTSSIRGTFLIDAAGTLFASCCFNLQTGYVRAFDLLTGATLWTTNLHAPSSGSMSLGPGGRLYATSSGVSAPLNFRMPSGAGALWALVSPQSATPTPSLSQSPTTTLTTGSTPSNTPSSSATTTGTSTATPSPTGTPTGTGSKTGSGTSTPSPSPSSATPCRGCRAPNPNLPPLWRYGQGYGASRQSNAPLLGPQGVSLGVLWSRPVGGSEGGVAIGGDGTVYLASTRNSAVYALNGTSGGQIWAWPVPGDVWLLAAPSLSSDGSRLYVIDAAGSTYCLFTGNGTQLWRWVSTSGFGAQRSSPLLDDRNGRVWFGQDSPQAVLRALNAVTGAPFPSFNLDCSNAYSATLHPPTGYILGVGACLGCKLVHPISQSPGLPNFCTNANRGPVVVGNDGSVFSWGGFTVNRYGNWSNALLWTAALGGAVYAPPALSSDQLRLYVVGVGSVTCLSVATGTVLWSFSFRLQGAWGTSTPVEALDGKLYVCADACYCLVGASGAFVWSLQLNASSPVVVMPSATTSAYPFCTATPSACTWLSGNVGGG